jgi:hypothetical protein
MLEAKYPQRHNAANPYFNYPLAPVLAVNAGGTPVGTAHGALETFEERLPGRGIAYTNCTSKIEAAVTHLQIAEASLTIDSADAHVRLACALMDDCGTQTRRVNRRCRAFAISCRCMRSTWRSSVQGLMFSNSRNRHERALRAERFRSSDPPDSQDQAGEGMHDSRDERTIPRARFRRLRRRSEVC